MAKKPAHKVEIDPTATIDTRSVIGPAVAGKIGRDCLIGRGVELHGVGRVDICADVSIAAEVRVAAGADERPTTIGFGVAVMPGARLEAGALVGPGSVVGRSAIIGAGAVLGAGSAVGEFARVAPGSVVAAGARVEATDEDYDAAEAEEAAAA